MLNRFATLSTVVMGSWIVILSPVPAVLTALSVVTGASALGLLLLTVFAPYRYAAVPVHGYRPYPVAIPMGFQEVVAPPAVVVQEVASTEPVSTVKAPMIGRCDYDDTLAAQELEAEKVAKRRAAAIKGLETKRRKLAEKEAAAKVAPKVKAPRKPRAAAKSGNAPE